MAIYCFVAAVLLWTGNSPFHDLIRETAIPYISDMISDRNI